MFCLQRNFKRAYIDLKIYLISKTQRLKINTYKDLYGPLTQIKSWSQRDYYANILITFQVEW